VPISATTVVAAAVITSTVPSTADDNARPITATVVTAVIPIRVSAVTVAIGVVAVIDDSGATSVIGITPIAAASHVAVPRRDIAAGKQAHQDNQDETGKQAFDHGLHGGDSIAFNDYTVLLIR
jgi:hypothetical protein